MNWQLVRYSLALALTATVASAGSKYIPGNDSGSNDWNALQNIPAGFNDGVDDTGSSGASLDLGNDGAVIESTSVTRIATTGDNAGAAAIVSEPTGDKVLFDMTKNWPNATTATALAANGAQCPAHQFPRGVTAAGAAEDCTTFTDDDITDNITANNCVTAGTATLAIAMYAVPGGAIDDDDIQDSAIDGGAGGEITDKSVDGEDLATSLGGRSLVLSPGAPDKFDAGAELYTRDDCFPLMVLAGIDETTMDFVSVFHTTQARTATRLWCKTDSGTLTANLRLRHSGSAADIGTADLVCDNTGNIDACASGCDTTINASNDNFVSGDDIDMDLVSKTGTPKFLTICITWTGDDST